MRVQYKADRIDWYPESRLNKFVIKNQLEDVYGKDKYRWLYPGEEAMIIETILLYLRKCEVKLDLLQQSVQSIVYDSTDRNASAAAY